MAHWDERPAGAGDRRDSSDSVRPEASRERPPAAEKLANVILSFADWPAFAGRLGLTDQELEFLRLALAGRTAAETASVLGISPEEARQCQAAVFEQLGVRDDGELVLRIATESLLGGSYGPQAPAASARSSDVPHWDPDRRELWFAGVLIKKFRKPAPVQQRILDAFQAAGWVPRIADPLPPQDGRLPSQRLHDAITNLNRRLRPPLIRFGGDGTGQGVCWQPAPPGTEHRIVRSDNS